MNFGQDVIGIGQEIQPCLDFAGLPRILLAGHFNAGLNFTKRYGGQMETGVVHGGQPCDNGAMRP
jgi:hypothetical protein